MRRAVKPSIPFALMLTIALLQVAPGAWADAPVWRVTDGESTVYLGGTVHLLRPEDYPLPEEFDQAYEGSSEVFFETDISSMNDLSVQAQMLHACVVKHVCACKCEPVFRTHACASRICPPHRWTGGPGC